MTIDNAPVWAGLAALVINQIATQAREERRHRHNIDDRKDAEKAASVERANIEKRAQEERSQMEQKAIEERRRVIRQIKNLRPDAHCYARGCTLAGPGTGPQAQPAATTLVSQYNSPPQPAEPLHRIAITG